MTAVLVTSISGWMALMLLLGTLTLPYLARYQIRRSKDGGRGGYYALLRPHYVIGYLILILTLIHLLVSMSAGMARGTSLAGLNIASMALLLIVVQIILGSMLRDRHATKGVTNVKRWHFLAMLGIIALISVHLAKNSILLGVVSVK